MSSMGHRLHPGQEPRRVRVRRLEVVSPRLETRTSKPMELGVRSILV